jgi:nucleoid DNA-binding protein
LFTWGQSTLAPSPFSPGSSREKEYVLTTWSKEKTAYEGLDLLRKTVEQIAQYKDYEKNQVNQNLKITRACEKSLAALDNFVQHLAQKVAAKQTLSIQRLGELERRLNAFKNRRNISSSAKSSEVSLLLSTETKPRSLSGKLSNHKALKKWVLEQISETQRTIQQTQKSLDNERKHLLYNWLSTSK